MIIPDTKHCKLLIMLIFLLNLNFKTLHIVLVYFLNLWKTKYYYFVFDKMFTSWTLSKFEISVKSVQFYRCTWNWKILNWKHNRVHTTVLNCNSYAIYNSNLIRKLAIVFILILSMNFEFLVLVWYRYHFCSGS